MAKEMISLRIDPEARREITFAASWQGKSVTEYLVDAALAQARTQARTRRPVKGGVPRFFRLSCETAKAGGGGYRLAGYNLCLHAFRRRITLSDGWCQLEEGSSWDPRPIVAKQTELLRAVAHKDSERTLAWFEREYPGCMKLVPTRRRESFLAGVHKVIAEVEAS